MAEGRQAEVPEGQGWHEPPEGWGLVKGDGDTCASLPGPAGGG